MLNESKGNMYPFVTHTHNPIKGKCYHSCLYCYMKKWGTVLKPLRLVESELRDEYQPGQYIFIGSSTDMWLAPDEMLEPVLDKCLRNTGTKYLFQTKDPGKFEKWIYVLNSLNTTTAVTIESNRDWNGSNAPSTAERYLTFQRLPLDKKMISIEPVMDFDVDEFLRWIQRIRPDFVSIGANTNYQIELPEPSPEKLHEFIEKLVGITKVIKKMNLGRIWNQKSTRKFDT